MRVGYRKKGVPLNDFVHRVMYRLFRGPIPAGLFVLHHCDNPPCGNPRHLVLGTHRDNQLDRWRKGRTGSVLSTDQQALVRRRYLAGESTTTLAREFGVSPATIYRFAHYRAPGT